MSGREDRPEEVTDTQLDALLDTAAADLLRQVKATSDTSTLLSAFLETNQTAPSTAPAASPAPAIPDGQTLITIRALDRVLDCARDRAYDLLRALDRGPAPDSARDLARGLARTPALVRDLTSPPALVRDFVRDLAHALAHAHDLAQSPARDLVGALLRIPDLARDRDLAQARDLAFALARDLARDRALVHDDLLRVPDLDQDHRDLAHGLVLKLARARRRVPDLVPYLDRALNRARNLALVLDLTHELTHALTLALALALPTWPWAELRELADGQVDASGADLTRVDVSDLTVLSNVIWSDDTLWPAGTRPRIRAHSDELRPGVYLVRGGNERENANTLR
ncbi:hypothetical protein ABZ915_34615 [Streptomyces sp. NPDC046915]|uniref:hypothetical protein n=1 Tax=Streptomyces sp. NPDC046915 TaxID=3155257 RepID=UPI0033EB3472